MRRRLLAVASAVLLAACSRPPGEHPASTSTTTTSTLPAKLSLNEITALEQTPGSTPALGHAVESPSAPVPGLPGMPGPSPAFGPVDAPVRVVVFTDFQCPVCRRVVEPLKYLARTHPNDVRLVVKQNALPIHPHAARAAAAALAAFRQEKFWEYQDRLFANPQQLDEASLIAHAQALGLDVARFQQDMDGEAVQAQIKYETAIADHLGLRGTPAFVVNAVSSAGWGSYTGIESSMEKELQRAHALTGMGIPPPQLAFEATRQAGPKGAMIAEALFIPPAS